jgi:hypothetical protein
MIRELLREPIMSYAQSERRDRENEGDLHEGFNLGLDPTIAETLPSFQELKKQKASQPTNVEKDGHSNELEHGANLWPDEKVWDGASEFVSSSSPSSNVILTFSRRKIPFWHTSTLRSLLFGDSQS